LIGGYNFFAHMDRGGSRLDPNVRDALETLKQAA